MTGLLAQVNTRTPASSKHQHQHGERERVLLAIGRDQLVGRASGAGMWEAAVAGARGGQQVQQSLSVDGCCLPPCPAILEDSRAWSEAVGLRRGPAPRSTNSASVTSRSNFSSAGKGSEDRLESAVD